MPYLCFLLGVRGSAHQISGGSFQLQSQELERIIPWITEVFRELTAIEILEKRHVVGQELSPVHDVQRPQGVLHLPGREKIGPHLPGARQRALVSGSAR